MSSFESDKTSLLNLIVSRLRNSMITKYQSHEKLLFNEIVSSKEMIRSIYDYVSQNDDSLLSYLIVRKNLHFAAEL